MDSNHRFTDFKSVDSSAGLHAHLKLSLTTLLSYHILLTCQTSFSEKMVAMEGLEPPRFYPVDFESTASAIPPHSHKFGSPGGDCTHDLTLIRSVL